MLATTVKIHYLHDTLTGPCIAEMSHWTGLAIAGSRADLPRLLKRSEMKQAGVYLLVGYEQGRKMLYIGEAENVAERLRQHNRKPEYDFWAFSAVFASKDSNFTKAHIRYIEGELIHRAAKNAGLLLKNSTRSSALLPESDQAEMQVFIQRLLWLLPRLSVNYFADTFVVQQQEATSIASSIEDQLYHCKVKGTLRAYGKPVDNGFLVLAGSQVVPNPVPSCPKRIVQKTKQLIKSGILIKDDDGYRFTQDYLFNSLSGAASFLRGRSTSGFKAWLDENNKPFGAPHS